jgi:hypothetical protein
MENDPSFIDDLPIIKIVIIYSCVSLPEDNQYIPLNPIKTP